MKLRAATSADLAEIEALIGLSVRALSSADYTPAQIEGALDKAMGVDRQLIADATYYVVEVAGKVVACGGWSYRHTLFGNDAESSRDPEVVDPACGPARIRAFFVHPEHARQGLGSTIMAHCEAEARARGYRALELMATLPGQRLYAGHGFVAGETVEYALGEGLTIPFVPMTKSLAP